MTKLTEQTSVRLTADMREFLRAEAQRCPQPGASEGDIIRACIHYVMQKHGTMALSMTTPEPEVCG